MMGWGKEVVLSARSARGPGAGPGGLTSLGERVVAGLHHHLPALEPLGGAASPDP